MSDAALWLRAAFWDEVEQEIESVDWEDFAEFLAADRASVPMRPEFKQELRARLRDYVRGRYTS